MSFYVTHSLPCDRNPLEMETSGSETLRMTAISAGAITLLVACLILGLISNYSILATTGSALGFGLGSWLVASGALLKGVKVQRPIALSVSSPQAAPQPAGGTEPAVAQPAMPSVQFLPDPASRNAEGGQNAVLPTVAQPIPTQEVVVRKPIPHPTSDNGQIIQGSNNILPRIFSFLSLTALGNAMRVCKHWYHVQMSNDLHWQVHCLQVMKEAAVFQGTFKNRMGVFRNWKNNQRRLPTVWEPDPNGSIPQKAIVNGVPVVLWLPSRHHPCFMVQKGSEAVQKIELLEIAGRRNTWLISTKLCKNHIIALTSEGEIAEIDAFTGDVVIHKVFSKELEGLNWIQKRDKIRMWSSEKEIAVLIGSKLYLWNRQTRGKCRMIAENLDVDGLWFTPNYFICRVLTGGMHADAIVINRNTGEMTTLIKDKLIRCDNYVSEDYIVIDTPEGLRIWQDRQGTLTELALPEPPDSDAIPVMNTTKGEHGTKGVIGLHKNWLLLGTIHAVRVWDLRNQHLLFSINVKDVAEIETDGEKLWLRVSRGGFKVSNLLYDFSSLT